MATCRRTGTNESISTYDSAGGKDYSTLQGWEEATDINCITGTISPVLECYKGAHVDEDTFDGATTNATYFRSLRPALTEGHIGIPKSDGSCVEFHKTSAPVAYSLIDIDESYFVITDIVLKITCNIDVFKSVFSLGGANEIAAGILVYDSSNSFAGRGFIGIKLQSNPCYAINCFVHNCDGNGSWCHGFEAGGSGVAYFYNCVTEGNKSSGFNQTSGTATAKNCIAQNNGATFTGTWTQVTNVTSGVVFVDSANDDFHLDPSDTTARNQGTNLSADGAFAFNDDINDGVVGGAVAGQERGTDGHTWDIGMDEYMINHSINGVGTPYKFNGTHAEDIKKLNGVTN